MKMENLLFQNNQKALMKNLPEMHYSKSLK